MGCQLFSLVGLVALGLTACGGDAGGVRPADQMLPQEVQETTVGQDVGVRPRVELGPLVDRTGFRVTIQRPKGARVRVNYAMKCSDEVSAGIASYSGTSGTGGFRGTAPFSDEIAPYRGGGSQVPEPAACGIEVEAIHVDGARSELDLLVEALPPTSAE